MDIRQLFENSFYSNDAEKVEFLGKSRVLNNVFWINLLGLVGLKAHDPTSQRVNNYFRQDKQLRLENIADENNDLSLIIKLFHDKNLIKGVTANKLTRFLVALKQGSVDKIDEVQFRDLVKELKIHNKLPNPKIHRVVADFRDGSITLSDAVGELYAFARKQKICQEFVDLARLTYKPVAGASATTGAPATAGTSSTTQPTAPVTWDDFVPSRPLNSENDAFLLLAMLYDQSRTDIKAQLSKFGIDATAAGYEFEGVWDYFTGKKPIHKGNVPDFDKFKHLIKLAPEGDASRYTAYHLKNFGDIIPCPNFVRSYFTSIHTFDAMDHKTVQMFMELPDEKTTPYYDGANTGPIVDKAKTAFYHAFHNDFTNFIKFFYNEIKLGVTPAKPKEDERAMLLANLVLTKDSIKYLTDDELVIASKISGEPISSADNLLRVIYNAMDKNNQSYRNRLIKIGFLSSFAKLTTSDQTYVASLGDDAYVNATVFKEFRALIAKHVSHRSFDSDFSEVAKEISNSTALSRFSDVMEKNGFGQTLSKMGLLSLEGVTDLRRMEDFVNFLLYMGWLKSLKNDPFCSAIDELIIKARPQYVSPKVANAIKGMSKEDQSTIAKNVYEYLQGDYYGRMNKENFYAARDHFIVNDYMKVELFEESVKALKKLADSDYFYSLNSIVGPHLAIILGDYIEENAMRYVELGIGLYRKVKIISGMNLPVDVGVMEYLMDGAEYAHLYNAFKMITEIIEDDQTKTFFAENALGMTLSFIKKVTAKGDIQKVIFVIGKVRSGEMIGLSAKTKLIYGQIMDELANKMNGDNFWDILEDNFRDEDSISVTNHFFGKLSDKDREEVYKQMDRILGNESSKKNLNYKTNGTLKFMAAQEDNAVRVEMIQRLAPTLGNMPSIKKVMETGDIVNLIIGISSEPKYKTVIDTVIDQLAPSTHRKLSLFGEIKNGLLMGPAIDYLYDDVGSPIKPLKRLEPSDLKRVLKYNNFSFTSVRKKSKSESYSQYIDSVRGLDLSKDIAPLAVTKIEEEKEEVQKRTVEFSKYNNGKHGDIGIEFLETFDVDLDFPEHREFVKNNPTPTIIPAFHGTGSIAASMILRFGFRVISSTDGLVTGRMLGNGIYFSNVTDKASQYIGDEGYGRRWGTIGYLFEMDAYVGEKGKHHESAGLGRDAIRSPEWCVFDARAQLKIRRAHKVKLVPTKYIEGLKQRYPEALQEDKYFRRFKHLLKESETVPSGMNVVTYIFKDGNIPDLVTKEPIPFEKWEKKYGSDNLIVSPSQMGPSLTVVTPARVHGFIHVPDTDEFVYEDPEGLFSQFVTITQK